MSLQQTRNELRLLALVRAPTLLAQLLELRHLLGRELRLVLALTRIFFGLTPYFDPQILIADPFILILILKNFDQNL